MQAAQYAQVQYSSYGSRPGWRGASKPNEGGIRRSIINDVNVARKEKNDGVVGGAAPVVQVVVSREGCCMSHVVTQLLCSSLGVSPRLVEIVVNMQQARQDCDQEEVPLIFIGGRLLGGIDRLLAEHMSGNLVPQLKEAGALWL